MGLEALIPAGVGIVGSLISSGNQASAASDASNAQVASSASALAEQRRQFDLAREDSKTYRDTGNAANIRLRQLLGLTAPPGSNGPSGESEGAIRARLMPRFTTTRQEPVDPTTLSYADYLDQATGELKHLPIGGYPGNSTIDETGLSAAIQAEVQRQKDESAKAGTQENPSDFGSLLRRFSASDLAADPVYNSGLQFGLNEGIKGINARAIAGRGYDSGATLKALTRYGNDYGSTKANESYNRYNTDQGNIYNRLAGISGTGQTAVGQVTAAGQNSTNAISDLLTGAGNSRAAGIVGGANAWGSGANSVNNALNGYQSYTTLQKLIKGNSGGGNGYDGYNDGPGYNYGYNDGSFGGGGDYNFWAT